MDRGRNAAKGMMALVLGLLITGCMAHQEESVVYRQGPPADEQQPTWGRRMQPTHRRYGQPAPQASRPQAAPQQQWNDQNDPDLAPGQEYQESQAEKARREALRRQHQAQVNRQNQRFQWRLRASQLNRVLVRLQRREWAYRMAIRSHRRLMRKYRLYASAPEYGYQPSYAQRAQYHASMKRRYQNALRGLLARKYRLRVRVRRYLAMSQGRPVPASPANPFAYSGPSRRYVPSTASRVQPRQYAPSTTSRVQPRQYAPSTASRVQPRRTLPSATPSLVQPKMVAPPVLPNPVVKPVAPSHGGEIFSSRPSEPSYAAPAVGDNSLAALQAFCKIERSKYKASAAPKFTDQIHLQTRLGMVDIQRYQHGLSESIQAIGASKDTVLLGVSGRFSQAFCGDRSISVWFTPHKRMVTLTPPIRDYLLQHRSLHPWFQGVRQASSELEVAHLDLTKGVGGLLLHLPRSSKLQGPKRSVYLHWDIRNNKIVGHLNLMSSGCHGQFRVVGFDAQTQRLLLLRQEGYLEGCKLPAGKPQRKALLAIKWPSGERQILSRFEHAHRLEKIVASEGMAKIALAEYTELPDQQGHAIVVDTVTGKTLRRPIPKTPYGLLFTPDQQALLVYSAKEAVLVRVPLSLAAGKAEVKTRRLGHAMGLSKDRKKLFLLFHSGVEIRDAETLKPLGFVSLKKTVAGSKFIHVDGSAILQGTLFVKNGEMLHIHTPS
ncbi:MAG: hypothetical protein H6727_07505 [Myxococcales bacterium]|nr:hypothetical protein [Myxococcales bacterium]